MFNILKYFKSLKNVPLYSYSQTGEDRIISFIFKILGIEKPFYIDIGAHHPFNLSNTYLFYKAGACGINIEPDPHLFNEFLLHRKRDLNLNIGIGVKNGTADFYEMTAPTLNTFSKDEAMRLQEMGTYKIKSTKSLPVQTFDWLISEHIKEQKIHLLNIDAEGLDNVIISMINFNQIRPLVICIETLSYSERGDGIKNKDLIEYIISNGYLLFADTYINSIFVYKKDWLKTDSDF
jgi:FkbM family methyltransferase